MWPPMHKAVTLPRLRAGAKEASAQNRILHHLPVVGFSWRLSAQGVAAWQEMRKRQMLLMGVLQSELCLLHSSLRGSTASGNT